MDDIFNMEPEPTPEEIAQKKLNQQKMAAKNPPKKPMPLTEGEGVGEALMEDYNPLNDEEADLPYMPFGNKPTANGGRSYGGNGYSMPGPNNSAPEKFDPNMLFQKGHPLAAAAKKNGAGMRDLMGTFDNMGVNTINAGGKEVNPNSSSVLGNVKETLTYAAEHLENPENWLPEGKKELAPKLKAVAEKHGLIKALKSYIAFIEKCE